MGPVSKTLERERRRLVWQRDIVIWLDTDETYTDFVDSLRQLQAAGELPYSVKAFRGSHLQLMLELEPLTSTSTRHPLVVHMPTFNVETVKQTPLLELYLAGRNFQKRLTTLVTEAATGKVPPEQLKEFCSRRDLTLAQADAWLDGMLRQDDSELAGSLRMMSVQSVVDGLLGRPAADGMSVDEAADWSLASRLKTDADRNAVRERFSAALGMPTDWQGTTAGTTSKDAETLAFVAASWAMCVEYVDDLRRPAKDRKLAPAEGLSRPLVDACRALADHLRARYAGFYQRTADETQGEMPAESEHADPSDLGMVDTFRFEEEAILDGALAALEQGDWDSAFEWAVRRIEGESFWLQQDPERQNVWTLIRAAALLGRQVQQAGPSLGHVDGHEQAVQRYIDAGAAVDQAHRELEQRRRSLLYPRLPKFDRVRGVLDRMREVWREWADGWAVDFNRVCRDHGFLPPAMLQQRHLFNDIVVPLCQSGDQVAIFVVDGFRFEMAGELFATVADAKATTSHLTGRLAELPTVTAVGMNALAPVVRGGRITPEVSGGKFRGFSTGQYRVHDPDSRKRAMHERVGGRTCPRLSLREAVDRDVTSLKRAIAQARLIFVHSHEIDDAGEKDLGPVVFDYALQNILAAWRLLREAGVRHFVITADHGFLLRDGVRDVQTHGMKVDPTRRHVLSTRPADHRGEVHVPLADLQYDCGDDTPLHLIFPETTAAFDIGDRSVNYLHGGNSLQERLTPVITISHRQPIGGDTHKFQLQGQATEPVGGMHCLQATLTMADSQSTLDFERARAVDLSLRVVDTANVSVDLCDVRGGGATLRGTTIAANVGEQFELFFRLSGEADARAQVELYHPGAEVEVAPAVIDSRFTVTVIRAGAATDSPATPPSEAWLDELPDEGARKLFGHLAKHGAVTESEAFTLLGDSRQLRRFSRQFESLAKKAPFEVRIDVVGGVKRYVRERESGYEVEGGQGES